MEIRISEELNTIINFSREEAIRTGSYGISPDHLMLGIIRQGDNTALDILKGLETDIREMKSFIDSKIFTNEHIPYSEAGHVTFSRGAQNVLSITVLEATRLNGKEASSQHLLLALCRNTGSYSQSYLRDTGIDYGRVMAYIGKAGLTGMEKTRESLEIWRDTILEYAVMALDYGPDVRSTATFTYEGLRFAMTHYRENLPEGAIDVAVCGHTHRPVIVRRGRGLLVNPGSPTYPRTMDGPSMARMYVQDGQVLSAEIVSLMR